MVDSYNIVYSGGTGEIIEKKSRFIATVQPVETEEEAVQFLETMKKKYWDARHNCSAYVLGERSEILRCSDDGEPSGTAGKPMLDVLLGEGITNVVVVVTRYFGGTLLGTGGLVRAYQKAVKEGLSNCLIVTKQRGTKMIIHSDYTCFGKIQFIAGQMDLSFLDIEYSDAVAGLLVVPKELVDSFHKKAIEATSAKIRIETIGDVYYTILDGTLIEF